MSESGIANKLERIINRTKELRLKKERELKLLSDKEGDLMHLLNEYNAQNVDDKALRLKIKQIAKSFNAQRKEMQKKNKLKRKKEKKIRKKEKKMKQREKKKKNKNKKGNDAVFNDEKKEETELATNEEEFVEIDAETLEESEDGSSTIYSEGGDEFDDDDDNEVEPGNEDEFDLIFEGF